MLKHCLFLFLNNIIIISNFYQCYFEIINLFKSIYQIFQEKCILYKYIRMQE